MQVGTDTPQHSYNRHRVGYIFVLPALVMYIIFFLYPFLSSIYLSLTDWDGINPMNYIGLENYQRLLGDPQMWNALGHNITWVLVGTFAPIAIGLLLAVLLWSNTRGQLVFRTVYFMPVVMSSVVVGIIWGWVYNPIFGFLNHLLEAVGLGGLARGWLGETNTALYAVMVAAIWQYVGFCVVILFAGLQKVDIELIEAARIDGANSWQRFINVIIPQLRHVLTMVTAYTVIGGFNVFDIVFILTKGGPANATELIATYTYKKSFQENDVGYGAALSMVMTILALVATIIFMRIRSRGEELE
ncbi:MAG: sugar ABC transporter permease [Anaerolineae bacterium]|nr:sugar ABC transporter permease [Anaerolineae bacterium]